jgi:LytS/YehU family sensor histidine kinase
MRYLVNGAQDAFVTLAQEVKFVEEYLELQRIRIPDQANVQIRQSIDYDGRPGQIAPLLLIPFIENAFMYGVSVDHECDINLRLVIKEQQLSMLITNRKLPMQRNTNGFGTGIGNARRQLELLYADQHELKITDADDQFRVDLNITLRN